MPGIIGMAAFGAVAAGACGKVSHAHPGNVFFHWGSKIFMGL